MPRITKANSITKCNGGHANSSSETVDHCAMRMQNFIRAEGLAHPPKGSSFPSLSTGCDCRAVITGASVLRFSRQPPLIGVVSETFAPTGKVFFAAFNLSEVKAAVLLGTAQQQRPYHRSRKDCHAPK
jgi:hypothetical protein